MSRRVGGIARAFGGERLMRVGGSVVDQILSSGTQFVVTILLAHSASPKVFGAASAILVVQGLLLGAERALVGDVVLLRCRRPGADLRHEGRMGLSLALAFGLTCSAILLLGSVFIGGITGYLLVVLAVITPITCVHDVLRSYAYGLRRVGDAVVIDGVWFGVQVAASVTLFALDKASAALLLYAWGLGAFVGLAVGLVRIIHVPTLSGLREWVSTDGSRAVSYLIDYLVSSGMTLISFLAVGIFIPLAEYGALRLAWVSMTPPGNMMAGVRSLTLGQLAEAHDRPRSALRLSNRIGAVLAAVVTVYGVALVAAPTKIGALVFGDPWPDARWLAAVVLVGEVFRLSSLTASDVVRIFGSGRLLVRTRLLSNGGMVVAMLGGGALFGAPGAAVASSTVLVGAALLWWWQARVVTQERRPPRPDPGDAPPGGTVLGRLVLVREQP